MLSNFSPSPAVAPLSTVPHHSALPATDQMNSLAQPKLLWSSSGQVTDPSQTPWAQGPSRCLPGQQLLAIPLPTTTRGCQPTARLAPPPFLSSTHGQGTSAASTLIRTGGGVLSSWFGTISMMHSDSLGQAYALNPQEKGSF